MSKRALKEQIDEVIQATTEYVLDSKSLMKSNAPVLEALAALVTARAKLN